MVDHSFIFGFPRRLKLESWSRSLDNLMFVVYGSAKLNTKVCHCHENNIFFGHVQLQSVTFIIVKIWSSSIGKVLHCHNFLVIF